jgi:hypothetical protein
MDPQTEHPNGIATTYFADARRATRSRHGATVGCIAHVDAAQRRGDAPAGHDVARCMQPGRESPRRTMRCLHASGLAAPVASEGACSTTGRCLLARLLVPLWPSRSLRRVWCRAQRGAIAHGVTRASLAERSAPPSPPALPTHAPCGTRTPTRAAASTNTTRQAEDNVVPKTDSQGFRSARPSRCRCSVSRVTKCRACLRISPRSHARCR